MIIIESTAITIPGKDTSDTSRVTILCTDSYNT
jgi:hypothetical protein